MQKVFIIAEAGVNHNGDINIAKKLITRAKESGADAIKFQIYKTSNLVTKDCKLAQYQKQNIGENIYQYEMLKRLQLTYNDFRNLKSVCEQENIQFIASVFDLESIDFYNTLNLPLCKIPSGEINNVPYLRKIAEKSNNILLSTGMCEIEDISFAIKVLNKNNKKNIIILHCNSNYPARYEEVNLLAMKEIGEIFQCKVGYSDHTNGIEIPIAAVALGATVIEKHFTLDKFMEGPDHKASLEPKEFKKMVNAIRNVQLAIGDGKKHVTLSESINKDIVRKSIVAKTYIEKGQVFSTKNITTKRPAGGISPEKWDEVIGSYATKNYKKDEMI